MPAESEIQDNAAAPEGPETAEPVRGIGQFAKPPKAQKVKPLAAVLAVLVVAGLVMFMAMASRNHAGAKPSADAAPRVGTGPAQGQEKSMLDDFAQHGQNTGQSHLGENLMPVRTSLEHPEGIATASDKGPKVSPLEVSGRRRVARRRRGPTRSRKNIFTSISWSRKR